jgi:hypothetical protein
MVADIKAQLKERVLKTSGKNKQELLDRLLGGDAAPVKQKVQRKVKPKAVGGKRKRALTVFNGHKRVKRYF